MAAAVANLQAQSSPPPLADGSGAPGDLGLAVEVAQLTQQVATLTDAYNELASAHNKTASLMSAVSRNLDARVAVAMQAINDIVPELLDGLGEKQSLFVRVTRVDGRIEVDWPGYLNAYKEQLAAAQPEEPAGGPLITPEPPPDESIPDVVFGGDT